MKLLKKIGLVVLAIFGLIGLAFLLTSGVKTHIEVEQSIYIDVPREELWKITALDFGGISKWIATVNRSSPEGEGFNGSACTQRVCEVSVPGFDRLVERFIEYDPENYRFKYEGVEGIPFFVNYGYNEWTHEVQGKGTLMTMRGTMEISGLMGIIMKPLMESNVGGLLGEALEELKVYAETGEQHPRKKAAMAKYLESAG